MLATHRPPTRITNRKLESLKTLADEKTHVRACVNSTSAHMMTAQNGHAQFENGITHMPIAHARQITKNRLQP